MGRIGRREDLPLSYKKAREQAWKLWCEGKVVWVEHARERARERAIDHLDVRNLLRTGRIVEHSKPASRWRYLIVGTGVDAQPIGCVFELASDRAILVTVRRERRGR